MLTNSSLFYRLIVIIVCLAQFFNASSQINFGPQAQFKYLKGSEAASLPDTWKDIGFDDASWDIETAPIYYDVIDDVIVGNLPDMQNSYSTVYMRGTFTATDVHLISVIELGVDFDDGFIVWINGEYLHSVNAPDPPSYNAFSTDLHENGTFEYFTFDSTDMQLVEGENTIAIQGFNTSLTSSDFLINVSLQAERNDPPLTGLAEVTFSHTSGYYDNTFSLTLGTTDNTTSIYYTLDGSHPEISPSTINAGNGTTILVNPNSTSGRGRTPGVVVRACLKKLGYQATFPVSRTFIFNDALMDQSDPGHDWPDYNVNGQIIDYDMDDEVTAIPPFTNEYADARDQIPTISIITDNAHLFDPSTGIYVNAWGHGIDWERECSVELFNSELNEGFNVNAGLRIRGGWSRHNDFPKHAFRLFFRALYGNSKLYYPLFEDEGVQQFDKIDLRCSQNYAWSNGRPGNSFVREVWSRDAQREMGQPYSRSRYYHLFLNGMYWGLFQTQERTEARFSADYHGGSVEDYDVIKVDIGENWNVYAVEATDGNTAGWREVWNMTRDGFSSNTSYFRLEGKDAYGNQDGSKVYVDIDNLIDYMVGIFYSGNYDAPTSAFSGDRNPNNFYAIDNRKDHSSGFIFYQHDAEHALFYEESEGPGIGIEMDRVNISMNVTEFGKFHPQWLHHKLTENVEYQLRFRDRAYKHLGPGGICTEEKGLELINQRVSEIDHAVLLESARWGDARWDNLQTRDDHWQGEINSLRYDFFPERTAIVIDQLDEAGLWTTTDPPTFWGSKGEFEDHVVTIDEPESIEIRSSNPNGYICYTTNGEDPRLIGGQKHAKAILNAGSVAMNINNSTVINARIKSGNLWSSLATIKFMKEKEDYSELKVTELHYHPVDRLEGSDTIYGEDYEFIEFKNTGNHAIDLSGLTLDSAVYYQFPDNKLLTPKEFFVVASNPGRFYEVHGLVPSGNYRRSFSNAGELIVLEDRDQNEILRFRYDDVHPWPFAADGRGKSMVSSETNPKLSPGDAAYWIDSHDNEGSPFADDQESTVSAAVYSLESELSIYPNPTSDFIIFSTDKSDKGELYAIKLYNLSGSLVFATEASEGEEIFLGGKGLTSGLYFIELHGNGILERMKLIYKAP